MTGVLRGAVSCTKANCCDDRLVALSKGQLQPEQVILLGDTPYDIQAAAKAGVGVIAFRCGDFDDAQLADALIIYDAPADLLEHYERSPLGQRKFAQAL